MRSINKTQILIGSAALFLGLLLYLLIRPLDHTYLGSFIEICDKARRWDNRFLSEVGGVLPAGLHVFAFSLLLGGLLACRKGGYLIVCCAWFVINVLFELGQRHSIMASQFIPKWFEGLFILENVESYFLKGRFDLCDVLASLVGAVMAYSVLVKTRQEGRTENGA